MIETLTVIIFPFGTYSILRGDWFVGWFILRWLLIELVETDEDEINEDIDLTSGL